MSITNDELPVSNNSDYEYTPSHDDFQTLVDWVDDSGLDNVPEHQLHDQDWEQIIDVTDYTDPPDVAGFDLAQPETVCGRDDRVKIPNTTIAPYKFICKLFIKGANGKRYIGSGFFIGPRCIITSGHCLHSSEGWVEEILVVPGMNGERAPFGSQVSKRFYSVNGWINNKNSDFDYGAIILPDNTLFNRVRGHFGYKEVAGLPLLNNAGYPGDKQPHTELWYNAGRATRRTEYKFYYMIDTAGGQSGSPTYVRQGNGGFVVGVHGYGGCPNKCVRVQGSVLQRWAEWRQMN